MTPRFRLILIFALLVALAGGGWWWWSGRQVQEQPAVLTAPVSRATIEETVMAEGTVKPLRLVAVGAQASGRILSVDVTVGQQVREGDLIAQIDSVTQQNALRNAEASLSNVRAQLTAQQAQLALAERTLERQTQLRRNLSVTQADLDTAEEAVNVARAQIEALEAQIDQAEISIETARANLDYTRITAPIDGTVLAVVSQQGQTVNAAQQAPTIVVLGQLDQMQVLAQISEADVVRVEAGQPVWFTTLGDPQRVWNAVLESVEPAPASIVNDPSISGTTGSGGTSEAIYYNGYFSIPNEDGDLRTYMTAQVHIVLGRAEDALTIPSVALGAPTGDGSYSVSVQTRSGLIEQRQIRIGLNDRVRAEVLDGLAEGEMVVTRQLSDTAPGAPGRSRRGPMGF